MEPHAFGGNLAAQISMTDLLRTFELFADLDEETLKIIAEGAIRRKVRAGDPLFYEHDPGGTMYMVESGTISIERVGDRDTPVQIAIRRAGEMIGELTVFEDIPRTADARATEETHVVILDGKHILHCIRRSPELGITLIRALSRKLRQSIERKFSDDNDPLVVRVAKALIEEGRLRGDRQTGVGIVLPSQLTQRELATRVGGTREAVNRALADLRGEGIVETGSGPIVIKSAKKLKARAGVE